MLGGSLTKAYHTSHPNHPNLRHIASPLLLDNFISNHIREGTNYALGLGEEEIYMK
jgi:hypothetical protein